MKPALPATHFEHATQPLLRWPQFAQRLLRSASFGLLIVVVSLSVGILGYRMIVGLSWIDAYENAAMILSGMGPLAAPTTTAGKLFAGTYALFSGMAVLVIAGILFTPVVHRLLHRLHADTKP
jgi:hypothetical protein